MVSDDMIIELAKSVTKISADVSAIKIICTVLLTDTSPSKIRLIREISKKINDETLMESVDKILESLSQDLDEPADPPVEG